MSKTRLVEIALGAAQERGPVSLLEIGVGSGGVTKIIKNVFGSRIRYYCCDLNIKSVELAKSIISERFMCGHVGDFKKWAGPKSSLKIIISDTAINMNHDSLDEFFKSALDIMSEQ